MFRQGKAVVDVVKQSPTRFTALIGGEKITGIDIPTADDDYYHFFTALMNRVTANTPYKIGIDAATPDLFEIFVNYFPRR